MFCASCDQPFFASTQADGTRTYRSRCGCRLRPFDADQLERRVYAEAQRRAFGINSAVTGDYLATLAVRLFAWISLGATPDDITFVPRI
ncbi:MAG TPA: hypothetical protein VFZ32_17235 [Micromonosporaceae bacterium]